MNESMILDWVQPDNVSACEEAGLEMWMYVTPLFYMMY